MCNVYLLQTMKGVLGSYDRALWTKYEEKTNKMQQLDVYY